MSVAKQTDEELVLKFKEGDHRQLEQLWERVRYYVRWDQFILFGWLEKKDLESAAQEGLWSAVLAYDPEKGAKFATMAVTYMTNAVRHLITFEMAKRRRGQIIFIDNFNEDDESPSFEALFFSQMQSQHGMNSSYVEEETFRELLAQVRSRAEEQHRRVLQVLELLMEGRKGAEIAKELELSRGRISQIVFQIKGIVTEVIGRE